MCFVNIFNSFIPGITLETLKFSSSVLCEHISHWIALQLTLHRALQLPMPLSKLTANE